MKKITLLTLLCAMLAIPLGYSQSFSTGVEIGNNQTPREAQLDNTTFFGEPSRNTEIITQYSALETITHNTSNALETGFRCTAGNNSFYRDFDLAGGFGIDNDFEVVGVEFVPWFNGGPATSMEVTLNIYSTPTGTFPGGDLTLKGTTTVTVDIADNFTLLTIPVTAIVPAGLSMVYEVAILGDGANDHFIVANNQPQTGPSYWSSPAGGVSCDFPIVDLAVQFGTNMSLIMNVIGEEIIPPPGPQTTTAFCAESPEVPQTFGGGNNPNAFVYTALSSTTNPGDTHEFNFGVDGAYELSKLTITLVAPNSANLITYYIQNQNGDSHLLGAFRGGTTGLDTVQDLVFSDDGVSFSDWAGGTPAPEGYKPEGGSFEAFLAGMDVDQDWFVNIESASGTEESNVSAVCWNLIYNTGAFPTIVCPVDILASNTVDLCSAVVNYSMPTGTGGTITNDDPTQVPGSTFDVGETLVSFTNTNTFGGTAVCSTLITVEDIQLPVAVANVGITVTLDEFGVAFLAPSDMLSGSTDNCEVVLWETSNLGIFDCAMLGNFTLQGWVYDEALNMSEVIEFDVLVIDDMAPVIECIGEPVSITVSHNAENNIEAGYAVACPTGDNLFARRFVLADFGITEEFAFSTGKFGVQSTDAALDVTVNIWDVSAGFPAGYPGNATLLGSQVVNVPDGTANSVISYNFTTPVVVPVGVTTIIVEVSKDGPEAFFLGGTATLADESYLASVTCGLAEYATATSIGFPDANYYITAKGANTSSVVLPYQITLDDQGFALVAASDLIGNVEDNCVSWTAASAVAGDCDQTNPNDGTFENGFNCSSATDFRVANDIIVEAEGVFVADHITASIFSAAATIASVDVLYHTNAAGLPGDELFSHTMAPTSQSVIGENFGLSVHEIKLSVPEYTFYGGQGSSTTYWVELKVTDSDGGGGVYWVVTSSSSIGLPVALFNGGWSLPDPVMDGVMSIEGTCQGSSGFAFDCSTLGIQEVEVFVTDLAGNTSSCVATVEVIDDIAPVITCGPGDGLTTVTEDFESTTGSTPPTGWSNDIVVGNWDWKFGSGTMPNSDDFPTNAAIFDDDAAGAGEVNAATLTSPSHDLSGADSASMSYDYTLDELGAGEVLIVSAWDGSAWAQIALYDADVIPPTNSGPNDVTSMLNADFKMRFTFDDNDTWGWGAGIDNVDLTVVSAQAAPYQITLDDQGFALVAASDLIGNVEDNCVSWTAASAVAGDCDQTNPNDGTFENGFNCSSATDFRVANDIIVEAEGVFVADHITASIFSAAATIASVDVLYHTNAAGLPGDELFSHTMAPTSQSVIGENFGLSVHEIKLSVPEYTFYGGQGSSTTYWVELKVTDSDGGGGVYWVVTSSSSIGLPVALFNGGWSLPDPVMDGVMSIEGTCQGSSGFAFDCSTLGIQEVEVFVTDLAGNTSSCVATVEVIDDIAPVITCGPGDGLTTVTEDFESTTGSTPPTGWSNDIVVGNWDWKFGSGTMPNSDDFPTNAAIFDDDAAGAGEVNAATLTSPSHDLSGADSASMSYDYTLDELGAGEVLIVSAWDGSAWAQIALYDADVIPPTNSGPMDVSSLMNADFKMRFTFDDAGSWGWGAGIDNVSLTYANPPTTSDVVVVLGEDGTATLVAGDYLSEQYDACGIDVLTADRYTYSCEDLLAGPITVTVTAVDGSGNASVCQATVVVVDTMAPAFTCPDDQSVMLDPDGTHTVVDYWDSIVVTDNCTEAVILLTQDPAPGTVLGFGMQDIVLTATDDYGNVTTCTFVLDLTILGTQDNELNNAISLYPNPANEQVTISNSSNIALETAMIYDLNGKLVSQINLQNMQSEKVINVATFATGVYMVYITGEQSSVVKRLIKE